MTPDEEDIFSDDPSPDPQPKSEPAPKEEPVTEQPKAEDPKPAPKLSNGTEKQAEMLLDKLFEKGFIVKLHIGMPHFRKKLTAKDLGKTNKELPDEIIIKGQKRLIKKSDLDPFTSIEGQARDVVDKYSTESWMKGFKFVSASAEKAVLDELEPLKKEYAAKAKAFIETYPKLREQMLKDYPEWASKLSPFYPPAKEVEKKFKFEVHGLGEDYQVTIVRREASVLGEAKVALKQNLMNKLNGFLESAVKDTRAQFVEQLSAMKDKLMEGGKIHEKSIKKLHAMIDVAKKKDFCGDEDFLEQLEEFKQKFSKDKLNDQQYKDTVTKALDQIVTKASDPDNVVKVVEDYKARSILV